MISIHFLSSIADVHVFKQDSNCNSTDLPLVKPNCDGDKSEFVYKNDVILFVKIFSNTLDINTLYKLLKLANNFL